MLAYFVESDKIYSQFSPLSLEDEGRAIGPALSRWFCEPPVVIEQKAPSEILTNKVLVLRIVSLLSDLLMRIRSQP